MQRDGAGRLSRRDTPFPQLDLESAQVETYFSPDDDPLVGLLDALQTAEAQVYVFFIMALAAAEAGVGLAIVIALFRLRESVDVDDFNLLKW